jgi:hypothetical protein
VGRETNDFKTAIIKSNTVSNYGFYNRPFLCRTLYLMRVQILKLLFIQFSSFSSLRLKYSVQNPVLKHPQSVSFPQGERPIIGYGRETGDYKNKNDEVLSGYPPGQMVER